MNRKKIFIISLFISFIIATGITLVNILYYNTPGIKALVASLVYSGIFGILITYRVKKKYNNKKIKIYFIVGFLNGILTSIFIFLYSSTFYEPLLLDIINGSFLTLGFFFVAPLYGWNHILKVDYEIFLLITSVIYMMLLLLIDEKINNVKSKKSKKSKLDK